LSSRIFAGPAKLGQIAIAVDDLDRATEFYRDNIGLKFLFQAQQMTFFDCGGVRIMLTRPEGNQSRSANSILYFSVDKIEETFTQMKDIGVAFIDQPHMIAKMPDHELWMVFFQDSEGNTMALMSEVR